MTGILSGPGAQGWGWGPPKGSLLMNCHATGRVLKCFAWSVSRLGSASMVAGGSPRPVGLPKHTNGRTCRQEASVNQAPVAGQGHRCVPPHAMQPTGTAPSPAHKVECAPSCHHHAMQPLAPRLPSQFREDSRQVHRSISFVVGSLCCRVNAGTSISDATAIPGRHMKPLTSIHYASKPGASHNLMMLEVGAPGGPWPPRRRLPPGPRCRCYSRRRCR